ncbi:MAG: [citrate (pro-3S)-lyase] ligase [Synergistaceae bacterium]|nr:[citrate (pro-3S)-lyase] ligase [Synergistaceae bacterium]
MYDYITSTIHHNNRRDMEQLDDLLAREGIRRDANIDYSVGMYDCNGNLIATGSCFANTIRCVAVDSARQGEGLLGVIVSRLLEQMANCGITHVFLYTKQDRVRYFRDMGFYEIASGLDLVAFLENRRNGFSGFIEDLSSRRREGASSALVMNCNPFTLGHRYLVERASAESETVHLFAVSEDVSLFPFADRYDLIRLGVSDLRNIELHKTGSYMVSSAVFPSYFLEDDESVITAQAHLDLNIFKKIASALGVSRRYVGTEPFSKVTGIYNSVMRSELPKAGIECAEILRIDLDGQPISASKVRQAIKEGDMDSVRSMVPKSTYDYLLTERGQEVIKRIRESRSVVHY